MRKSDTQAGRWALAGGLAVWLSTAPVVRAVDPELEPLTGWAHEGRSQRNRVERRELAEPVEDLLLQALASGARSCACKPRRLRWAWSLPRPSDREHPMIVVAFSDVPRQHETILLYERYAVLRHDGADYRVASVLTLRRPLTTTGRSLTVRMEPRRDLDSDGQLDISLHVEERVDTPYCAQVRFESARGELALREEACTAEVTAEGPDQGATSEPPGALAVGAAVRK